MRDRSRGEKMVRLLLKKQNPGFLMPGSELWKNIYTRIKMSSQ
jgi:hypothetical protein